MTAEPGTKRYRIFNRSRNWTEVKGRATPPATAPAQTTPEPETQLEDLTVARLQAIAEDLGLTGYKSLNKAALIAAIREAQAEE